MALESSARVAVTNAIDNKEDLGGMLGILPILFVHAHNIPDSAGNKKQCRVKLQNSIATYFC